MAITLKLPRPPHLSSDEFSRADLEFRGVDHSGPSFEARVFLDSPEADETTSLTADTGYAGSFHIFGHGGCFGAKGHCDVPAGPPDHFDRRLPHQLTPQFKTVIVTDALARLLEGSKRQTFAVTVVPIVRVEGRGEGARNEDPLKFDSVSLLTYEA